jgi:hypothetical protein
MRFCLLHARNCAQNDNAHVSTFCNLYINTAKFPKNSTQFLHGALRKARPPAIQGSLGDQTVTAFGANKLCIESIRGIPTGIHSEIVRFSMNGMEFWSFNCT